MKLNGLIATILLLLLSCETSQNTNSQREITRATLFFQIENQNCLGTCAVQRKVSNKITFNLVENAAAIIVRTCHRDQIFRDVLKSQFVYQYTPAFWVENVGECSLEIHIIYVNAKQVWGFASFSSEEDLNGTIFCNGEKIVTSLGVGVCQARTGLIQRVSFDHEVEVVASAGCPAMTPEGAGWAWQWPQGKGYCVYAMRSKSTGKKMRIVARGYSQMEQ